MFNLIKAWFKRQVVINFNVEAIPDDAKVCVLTTTHILTKELCEQLKDRLNTWNDDVKFIVVGTTESLQKLSDEDLKAIGLIRADVATMGCHDIPKENAYISPVGKRIVARPFLKIEKDLDE